MRASGVHLEPPDRMSRNVGPCRPPLMFGTYAEVDIPRKSRRAPPKESSSSVTSDIRSRKRGRRRPVTLRRPVPLQGHGIVADGAARVDDPGSADLPASRAARHCPRLARLAALRRLALAAAELEPAAWALPRSVAPLHRGAATKAALHGRRDGGSRGHTSKCRKSPGRGRRVKRHGRPSGRPENVVLREAR